MGRKAKQIILGGEQYKTLLMWERPGKTEQRLSKRAKVILLSSQGRTLKEISGQTGLSWQNCLKWRARFQEEGIEGLKDKERSGRPATIDPKKKTQVIALACQAPPEGNTSWSVRKLAKETGLGVTTIHRILTEGQIKPHKVKYWCGRSTDPEFEEKSAAIIGLYLNPPENAVVLAVDEKSQIQALDRTQPMLPMKEGMHF